MVSNSIGHENELLIKTGGFIIDVSSLDRGFREMERCRQEIWDYIQYRESLAKWPVTNGGMRSTYRNRMETLDERKN